MSVHVTDPLYEVIEVLVRRTGMATLRQRGSEVALAARELARERHFSSEHDVYARVLAAGEGHNVSDVLAAKLTIGETYFFRHPEVFRALESVVFPRWLAAGEPVHAWSAACSNGCEAYSLAIAWREFLISRSGAGPALSVTASDLNPGAIEQARGAIFSRWSVRNLAPELVTKWFDAAGDRFSLKPALRSGVTFAVHNLLESPARLGFLEDSLDVVFLRNVMIYFDGETVTRILKNIRRFLKPGGWLIPGASECNAEFFAGFETVNFPGAIFYRRPPGNETTGVLAGSFVNWEAPRIQRPTRRPPATVPPAPPARATRAAILEAIAAGRAGDALRELAPLLRDEELCADWHFLAALAHDSAGSGAQAEACYRRCLYLDRRHSGAQVNLACLLAASGRADTASRAARMALRMLDDSADSIETPRGSEPAARLREVLQAMIGGAP